MAKTIVRRRPELKLTEAIEKENSSRDPKKKGVVKTAVSMKAVEGGDLLTFDSMRPTDEQVEKINLFTRSPKTADELLVFPMLSCNDLYDRDDEGFKRNAIDQMHALEPPFSFVGKSFMMDHDYTVSKQIGRLFDEEVVTQDGIKFLKHWTYMPNTEQFAPIAEKIDFGVQWAVSVGLVMDSTACSICDSPMYKSSFFNFSFCLENGHEKGLYYDPDGEVDEYGWAEPVPEDAPGAVKCFMDMFDPRDGYEVSSVFLGAQYYAELAKDASFKGVIKAAAAGGVPILGLSSKEADSLPIPHEPERVREARSKYAMAFDEDGDPTWTDEKGIKWVYDSTNDEVLSLGKEVDDGTEGTGVGSEESGPIVRSDGDEGSGSDDAAAEDAVGGNSDGQSGGSAEGGEVVGSGNPEPGLNTGGESQNSQLIALAAEAGIPASFLESPAVKQAKSANGFMKALLSGVSDHIKSLQVRAGIGDDYIITLQSEAIDWYTKAHKEPDTKGVDTSVYEKMLDKVGDDIELLKSMVEEQKNLARAKFPQSVRRSSFETDANSPQPVGHDIDVDELREKSTDRSDETIRQIHR